MLTPGNSYEEVCRAFRWQTPRRYNMAVDVCDRHATRQNSTALIYVDETGREQRYSFNDIKRASSRFAHTLAAHGVTAGDRVGILLPQCPETAIAHVGCYRMGAVALPLFTLFGEEALAYRLQDSGAKLLVTDSANLPKIAAIRDDLPALQTLILTDGRGGDLQFWPALDRANDNYPPLDTAVDDPALLIYTSGTTGPPKGALHAHRILLGHIPSMEWLHEFYPQPGDLFWTPADWAWIGGLMDVLMPAWYHGVPVLACRARKFDPEEAFAMIARYKVRNTFLPPTALKLMRQVENPRARYDYNIRTIFSGGETMGEELLAWGRQTLGVTINEGYGQTEYNLAIGNCAKVMPVRQGSMGRAAPGHTVEIIDEAGQVLPPGQTGHIAFKTPHPVAMLEYWQRPEATREKFIGSWMISGDQGQKDEEGYFWFLGRVDDVIISAGYRIGPGEIEDCLLRHPAVSMAAAIGVPDPIRNEIVKALIVLKPGYESSEALKTEIQQYVKTRLAAHEYPRLIEFIPELPLTATGKIRRQVLREREQDLKSG
jgi:acetyl-CoA synthetase